MTVSYLGRGSWYLTNFIKQFKNIIPIEKMEEFKLDCYKLVQTISQNHPKLQKIMRQKYNLVNSVDSKETPFTWELIQNGNIILVDSYFLKSN